MPPDLFSLMWMMNMQKRLSEIDLKCLFRLLENPFSIKLNLNYTELILLNYNIYRRDQNYTSSLSLKAGWCDLDSCSDGSQVTGMAGDQHVRLYLLLQHLFPLVFIQVCLPYGR